MKGREDFTPENVTVREVLEDGSLGPDEIAVSKRCIALWFKPDDAAITSTYGKSVRNWNKRTEEFDSNA